MKKFKPLYFYIIFFLLCLGTATTVKDYDYDFWARLIAGMSVIQSGTVLKHDFLSYTPTHIWFDHEWGSGVIFYIVQHLFSSAGIFLLLVLLNFFIFFIITKIVALRGVKTTTAYNFLFYFFAFNSISDVLNNPIRCQIFSFLFFTLFIYILELAKKDNNKPLFAMPFLMIIWNNLHGGCVSGIGLILIYIVGEFLNKAPIKKYIYALIPTILILPINPWDFSYIPFLIKATTMPRPEITEWWGLFSEKYIGSFMKFKIFASILLLSELAIVIKNFSIQKLDKTKFLVLLTTLYLGIQHAKLFPFFGISAFCFIYDDFYTMFNSIIRRVKQVLYKFVPNLLNNFAIKKEVTIYLLILLFAATNVQAKSFAPLASWNRYPLQEIEFIKINNLKGNLFTSFGQGSYASYKLYPNNKIFMDGRYEEVYYDYMTPLVKKFYQTDKDWDEVLQKFPPNIILMEKDYAVYTLIKGLKNWKLIYKGKHFGVFVKADEAKKHYKNPPNNIEYYRKNIFNTDINFKKS